MSERDVVRNTLRKERYRLPFDRNPIISPELAVACRAAAEIFVFQSKQHTMAWVDGLPLDLRNEIIVAGLGRMVIQAREIDRGMSPQKAKARFKQYSALTRARAKAFTRIVEILDDRQIGAKKLGDCTRGDLLREAVRLENEAGELTLDASLYRDLAELIGNQTVRAAAGRDKIVALLTSRWSEEDVA